MSGTASSTTGRRRLRAVPERAPGTPGKGNGAKGNGARADTEVPAGLRYVNAEDPGMSRRRHGSGFTYRDAGGERVADEQALDRIRSVAIPPAWTNVWICPSPRGHIQATGRDARGRKQYRYHPLWRQVRGASKYERTIAFGEALPGLRRHVERDLRRPGLDRQKVVAAVVRLLDATLLRVGNEEYARQNRTYGLTTLRDQHGHARGGHIRLSFRGKGGKRHEVSLLDRRLARIMQRCQDLPGQRLFQYIDDDRQPQPIDSDDVNDYLRAATGDDFSARDFRTWAGSVLAFRCLRAPAAPEEAPVRALAAATGSSAGSSSPLTSAIGEVARWLGNTPAVCRSAYIHPAVLDAFHAGGLGQRSRHNGRGTGEQVLKPSVRRGLGADERELLNFLRRLQRRRAAA